MHTVIMGAGISGLAAAYALKQLPGETYEVYEKDARVGGLCRTQQEDGFTFDAVSHVLHFRSPTAERLVHAILDGNIVEQSRNAWIRFRQQYIPYPFQTHLGFLPARERATCLLSYMKAWRSYSRDQSSPPVDFEAWIRRYFGEGIARHFMIPYNTKLWGVPPRELSTDWVRPFVHPVSPWLALTSTFLKSSYNSGYNSSFYYPKQGGIQALIEGLANRVSPVRLNQLAVEIDLERKVVRFDNGQTASYDRLISTIPLRTLALRATELPQELWQTARELRCTSLLNYTYCVGRPLPHSFHWIYFPEPDYPFFRLAFPSNISPSSAPVRCSIISAEVSNPVPGEEDELDLRIRKMLVRLGFLTNESDIVLASRSCFDHAYPVHDLSRQARVARLLEFFNRHDVFSIGRFGSWHYSSIDDAIMQALEVARQISAPDSVNIPELLP
jgi:protoporphyrinogen oxidase